VHSDATENGVDPRAFRPSADRYGETIGSVQRCEACGHASLTEMPSEAALAAAYAEASDEASVEEEAGQLETARRSLQRIERFISPGTLVDIGCWTGSFVAAAGARGWTASGIEPSVWAVDQARARGLDVRLADLTQPGIEPATMRCVVMCDVIEHLLDVSDAIGAAVTMLQSGGLLYLTTPDAGGRLPRLMGQRWWSILPMHVQYFTRDSMRRLLERHGLRVVDAASHPKVFTARYYAGRLSGYAPRLAAAGVGITRRIGLDERLIAPDFRDRMQVLAIKD
jgi:predicted TPR repeat methyltransferase